MTDEKLDQPRNITLLPYQMQSGEILKQDTQSDIEIYKEILAEKFALAKTAEECDRVIKMRQTIQELDRNNRQLNYTEQSAKAQLVETQQAELLSNVDNRLSLVLSQLGLAFILYKLFL